MLRKGLVTIVLGGWRIINRKKEEAPKLPTTPNPSVQEKTVPDMMNDATKDGHGAMKDAKTSAEGATKDGAAAVKEGSAAMEGEVKGYIDQAMDFVKAGKLKEAEPIIARLKGMEASIPASLKPTYDQLIKAYDAAKMGTGKVGNLLGETK